MTNLTLSINVDPTQDEPRGSSGVLWQDIALGSDYLVFTQGNTAVANGQPLPTSAQLSSAGVVLTGSDITIPHYLLADFSANQLKECVMMGKVNHQYALAFVFDGATTSEPILEVWDDSNLNTTNLTCLGAGTPSLSWFHGITTTTGAPGTNWVGYSLAGSSDGHYLLLNNGLGALTSAKTLYCNLYLVLPGTQSTSGAQNPVICVKYTTT